jgi:hypothetical protein
MTTKKLLNSILVGCISLLVFSCGKRTPAQIYSGGAGTEADPYLISSKVDMVALASAVNGNSDYSSGKYFLLTQDITDTITTIIGRNDTCSFKGVFDGGEHKLTVNISTSNEYYAGVFGYTTGATIKNLGVAGSVSSSSSSSSLAYAGGICGRADSSSTITNCYNTGSVSSLAYAGGICGNADSSTITNCYNTGSVSSLAYAGGICGNADNSSTITNCYNTGSVSSSSDSFSAYTGGICGNAYNSTITNCYNTGSVSSYSSSFAAIAGGICGIANPSTITNCYNTGRVSSSSSSSSDSRSGGICGNAYNSTITNCYNTGRVSSSSSDSDSSYVTAAGGICGVLLEGTVNDCIAANTTITAKRGGSNNNYSAGRIVGYMNEGVSIVNCQALASMQINGNTRSSQDANSKDGKDIVGSYEILNAIGMLNAKQIIYGDESFLLNENNLPIDFQSSDTGIIDITENVLTVKKSGNVVITANYTWEGNDYQIEIRKTVEKRL